MYMLCEASVQNVNVTKAEKRNVIFVSPAPYVGPSLHWETAGAHNAQFVHKRMNAICIEQRMCE